jgi:hypothetical protein
VGLGVTIACSIRPPACHLLRCLRDGVPPSALLLTPTHQLSGSQHYFCPALCILTRSFFVAWSTASDLVSPSIRNTPFLCRSLPFAHAGGDQSHDAVAVNNDNDCRPECYEHSCRPTNMAPAANTNSLPNHEKAPATSHARHGSKSMEGQSRAVAARSRTGSDAREWGHVSESNIKQAQFDADPVFADQKPATSTTMTIQSEHDVTAEIEKHLRASGPRGIEFLPAFRNASTHLPITPDSPAELDMPRTINNPKLRHNVNFDRELHFRPKSLPLFLPLCRGS